MKFPSYKGFGMYPMYHVPVSPLKFESYPRTSSHPPRAESRSQPTSRRNSDDRWSADGPAASLMLHSLTMNVRMREMGHWEHRSITRQETRNILEQMGTGRKGVLLHRWSMLEHSAQHSLPHASYLEDDDTGRFLFLFHRLLLVTANSRAEGVDSMVRLYIPERNAKTER